MKKTLATIAIYALGIVWLLTIQSACVESDQEAGTKGGSSGEAAGNPQKVLQSESSKEQNKAAGTVSRIPEAKGEEVEKLLDIWKGFLEPPSRRGTLGQIAMARVKCLLPLLDLQSGTDGYAAYLLCEEMNIVFKEWRESIVQQCKIRSPKEALEFLMTQGSEYLPTAVVLDGYVVTSLLILGVPVDGFGEAGDPVWVLKRGRSEMQPCYVFLNARSARILDFLIVQDESALPDEREKRKPIQVKRTPGSGIPFPGLLDQMERDLYFLPWILVNPRRAGDLLILKNAKVTNEREALNRAVQEVVKSKPELAHALIKYSREFDPLFQPEPKADDGLYFHAMAHYDGFCFYIMGLTGALGDYYWIVRVALPRFRHPDMAKASLYFVQPTLQELWINARTGDVYPIIPWEHWGKEDSGKEYLRPVWKVTTERKAHKPPSVPATGPRKP
jgi:hypothetical protein